MTSPSGIDLWLLPPARLEVLGGEHARGVLADDEVAHLSRLVRPASRRQFRASRTLLRQALSRYADRAPGEWRFEREPLGRPRIVDAPDGLDFNVAHTQDLVVVAISRHRRVGVDVERTPATADLHTVRAKILTDRELRELDALPRTEALSRLLRTWVLKEAYTKALGVGLQRGFGTFGVELGDPPRLRDPRADRPWQLVERQLGEHCVALAFPERDGSAAIRCLDAARALADPSTPGLATPCHPQCLVTADPVA